ncbi:MAG: hypothetical protein K1X72_07065 [Pyrinomonadaceae bacterium]|nr:hypothetical protein [Pyrinomonadaceae bacterium]
MPKLTLLLIIIFLCAATSFSQEFAETPKLMILGQKWKKETSVSIIPNKSAISEQDRDKISSSNASPNYVVAKYFLYETTVLNQTGKVVKGFVWDYIFYDSNTKAELKRHQFFYSAKIKKNKKTTVKIMSQKPPSNLVRFEDYGKESQNQYLEKTQITCIVFDDKTIWYPPNLNITACKDLRDLILPKKKNATSYN